MIIKLLTEHHLEFLSLKGSCTGSSESTHVKMSHCWKSHAMAHICMTAAHAGRSESSSARQAGRPLFLTDSHDSLSSTA